MTSFTYKRRSQIEQVIQKLGTRLINAVRNDVTHEDIRTCFILPEHREQAVDIFNIWGLNGSNSFMFPTEADVGRASVHVSLRFNDSDTQFAMPNYCKSGMIADAPAESAKRVHSWVERRVKIGRQIGQAYDTFGAIADRCGSSKAVVFLMPCVIGLIEQIEEDDTAKALLDKLGKGGQPPLPALEPELRDAAETASKLFSRAMLADKSLEHATAKPVNLSLSGVGTVKNPWGTTQAFF